jgi:hypothetical protein
LISTSYKILGTIGDVIVGFPSKECILKFKLDAEDESTKVFLMRIFASFHVLGNSSDSDIRRCPKISSIYISQEKYLLESKP